MARDTTQEAGSSSSSGLSLAVRLRDGSADAWRDLIRLYGPLVDRWCRNSSVPLDSIPDIAQEVFLAAFRGLDGFDPEQPRATFRGWLWTVTRSRIADHFRRSPGFTARGGSTAQEQLGAVADPLSLEEPIEPVDVSALLHRALDQIGAEFTSTTWEMFWRATVLGHPTDMIAEDHSVTAAAVRQAKSRVLRRLRRQLGDQY